MGVKMLESFDWLSFLGGLLSGIAITLVSIRITKQQSVRGSGTVVDQSRAQASGDIVGRDKKS
jgi:hypothetical protein